MDVACHGVSQIDFIELLEHVLELVGEVFGCRPVGEPQRNAYTQVRLPCDLRLRMDRVAADDLSKAMAIRTRAAATRVHCLRNVAEPRHMSSSKEWDIAGMSDSGGSMSTRSRDRVDGVSRYGEKPKTTMPDTLTYAAGEGSTGVSDARCASRDEPPAVSAMRSTDTPSACDDVCCLSGILPSRHSAPANVCWKLFLGSERDNDRPAEIEQAAEIRGIRKGEMEGRC